MDTRERAERVKGLFNAALELATGERAVFLADACAGDESLRREVESLLVLHRAGDDFLRTPALGLTASEVAARLLEEGESYAAGQRVGAYRLLREIGRGGAGAVFLAVRDDDEYRKHVAVKLLKRGRSTRELVRRFRKERQILADLDHPNIARLLDGGTTETGLPYFVMEYVDGVPVDEYADARGLDLAARLGLFREVCAAVEFAHRRGVVHRDIKPSNVLVTEDGAPKLIDFGIAKSSPLARDTGESAVTPTAQRAMTPEYASPEQMRGEAVGAASDIYSLGVLLYKLLTGRLPYQLAGRSPYEVVRAVCEEEVRTPSEAIAVCGSIGPLANSAASGSGRVSPPNTDPETSARCTVNPQAAGPDPQSESPRFAIRNPRLLKGDLDNIVLTALRKEPGRRYATAAQLSEDLRRHLAGLPVSARRDTLAYRVTKFIKRNRAAVLTTVAAGVLCLLVGIFIALRAPRRDVEAPARQVWRSVAVLPFADKGDGETEYLADGLTEGLIDSLSHAPGLTVPARNTMFRYKNSAAAPSEIGRDTGAETVLRGNVSADGDAVSVTAELVESSTGRVLWVKRYAGKVSDVFSFQHRIRDDILRELGSPAGAEWQAHLRRRHSADEEAYRLYLLGRYFWAKRTKESFYKGIEYFRQAIERDPSYALAHAGLADCYGLLGAYIVVDAGEAFPAARAAAERALELDGGLAEAHTTLGLVAWLYDWDWAAADQHFLRAQQLDPRYVTAYHWRGLFLGEMARFGEAVNEMQGALKLDPVSPPIYADFGRVLFWARRYDEAIEKYDKAREMSAGVDFGALSVEVEAVYIQMGLINEWAASVDKHEGRDPRLSKAYLTLGMEGHWREKLRHMQASGERFAYDIAELYARLGDAARSVEALRDALRIRDHRLTQLKVNPAYDNVRSDPRFGELLRQLNLEP